MIAKELQRGRRLEVAFELEHAGAKAKARRHSDYAAPRAKLAP